MHIPDGFLSPPVWGGLTALSGVGLALCVRSASRDLQDEQVPLMGVMGAFVFAAQMINFPVAAGTSGHLVGGVLLAVLLGPAAACVVMACILAVQCLMFQDGGLTALGANFLNMGLLPVFVGYGIYRVGLRLRGRGQGPWAAIFVAAWSSTVLSAGLASVELAISGTVPLMESLVAMLVVHALIGLGEGAITLGVIRTLVGVRPALLPELSGPGAGSTLGSTLGPGAGS